MIDKLLQDPIGTLKAVLELGWPAIVLIMVVVLWLRINSERDKSAAALNGHVAALETALNRCHTAMTETLEKHDALARQQWGEAITQSANAAAIARETRQDVLVIRNMLQGASG